MKPAAPEPALTPWLPGSAEPVRVGVYQRRGRMFFATFSYWDGALWRFSGETPEIAASAPHIARASLVQDRPWRGLACEPGGAA